MKNLNFSNKFKKDFKAAKRRGKDEKKLHQIVSLLINGEKIPEKHRLHRLKGEFHDCYELHIEPDWLLIFEMTEHEVLILRTGSHSDLF